MRSTNYCVLVKFITRSFAANFCKIFVCDSFTIIFQNYFRALYLVKFGQFGTGVHMHRRCLAHLYTPPFLNHESKCHAYLDTYVCARARKYLLAGKSVYRPAKAIDIYVGIVRYERVVTHGRSKMNTILIILI